MAVRRPPVLPEFLTMIRDNDDECVIQNADLLQLADELLQAPVVMQHFAVIAIDSSPDKPIRIDSAFGAQCSADHRAAAILRFVPQLYVIAVEFSRFGRIGKLLFESGWGTVRRMRVGRVRIEKERLVAMLFQRSEERRVGKECRSGWWAGDEKKK